MDIMVMGRRVAAVRASENSRVGGAPLGAKKEHGAGPAVARAVKLPVPGRRPSNRPKSNLLAVNSIY